MASQRRVSSIRSVWGAALFLVCTGCASGRGNSTYILPFPPAAEHSLVQGFNGQYGHSGVNAFAYDFQSDIGSTVTAARGGVVVRVVQSNVDSPPRKPQPGKENVIVIDHGDGTFGRYYHLTLNGADVGVGQRVKQGQKLGRSGSSGASFMPHLHFDVARGCYDYGCPTVSFRFKGIARQPLAEDSIYTRR